MERFEAEVGGQPGGVSGRRLDRQTRRLPLRKAFVEPAHVEAARAQFRYSLKGQNAIRPAAVGDDFVVARQFGQALHQLAEGDVQSTGQMTEAIFILGAHVEQHDAAFAQPPHKLVAATGSN